MAGQERKREAAIAALLTERTIADAAATAGVSARTLKGWLKDPAFAEEYAAARSALVDEALAALQRANSEAVEALVRNLTCGEPADEIRAARSVLELALRLREQTELVGRIAALEGKKP